MSSNYFFCPRISRIYTKRFQWVNNGDLFGRTNHTNSNIFNALVTCVKCLEGTTERSDGNRVRSARIGEARPTCLEGTTPQDMPQSSALIALVRFVRPNRSPLNAKHEISLRFSAALGNSSKLDCTRLHENSCRFVRFVGKKIRGSKLFRGVFFCKVIPPRTPFPTETPKNNSRFFLLKSCSFKQESCFYPLYRCCPTIVVYLPHNCGEVAPQLR